MNEFQIKCMFKISGAQPQTHAFLNPEFGSHVLCQESQLGHHIPLKIHLHNVSKTQTAQDAMALHRKMAKTCQINQLIKKLWQADCQIVANPALHQKKLCSCYLRRTRINLPTHTWRRDVLVKRRESSCSSDKGVSNCTLSTAVKPRSKPQIRCAWLEFCIVFRNKVGSVSVSRLILVSLSAFPQSKPRKGFGNKMNAMNLEGCSSVQGSTRTTF